MGEPRVTLDELDGIAADPNHHTVLFENDEVRVIETRIAAGELTPLHTHLAPTVMYVLSGSHFIRRDEHGETMVDTRRRPTSCWPGSAIRRHTAAHDREHGR